VTGELKHYRLTAAEAGIFIFFRTSSLALGPKPTSSPTGNVSFLQGLHKPVLVNEMMNGYTILAINLKA
jgi:hypothetical protein